MAFVNQFGVRFEDAEPTGKHCPYVCRFCAMPLDEFFPRCPYCGLRFSATLPTDAERQRQGKGVVVSATTAVRRDPDRIHTGFAELDPVFGTNLHDERLGIAAGSVTLLWGPAGIGKTTLLLQMIARCGVEPVLYVNSENNMERALSTVAKFGANRRNVDVMLASDAEDFIRRLSQRSYKLVFVDSVSAMVCADSKAPAGTVRQNTLVCAKVYAAAQKYKTTMILLAHETEKGAPLGGNANKHTVDCTVRYDGSLDDPTHLRTVTSEKNRDGPSGVRARFTMTAAGLVPIPATPVVDAATQTESSPTKPRGRPFQKRAAK